MILIIYISVTIEIAPRYQWQLFIFQNKNSYISNGKCERKGPSSLSVCISIESSLWPWPHWSPQKTKAVQLVDSLKQGHKLHNTQSSSFLRSAYLPPPLLHTLPVSVASTEAPCIIEERSTEDLSSTLIICVSIVIIIPSVCFLRRKLEW